MPEHKNIAEVIVSIDQIVKDCIVKRHRAGYFAALYKRMTVAVSEGIEQQVFEDGPRMEKLDIAFAKRYLDAWNSFSRQSVCTNSWQLAFDGCSNHTLTLIQQLLLGINTHINLDLAIAAAQTAPGNSIHSLKKDFDSINNTIESLVDDIQKCLEEVWWPMKLIKRVSNKREEAVLNFSIHIARKTAWSNAVILAQMNNEQQAAYIQEMDSMVFKVGQKIINPGFWASTALKLVRLTEYEDIARTITLIDTTVVNPLTGHIND